MTEPRRLVFLAATANLWMHLEGAIGKATTLLAKQAHDIVNIGITLGINSGHLAIQEKALL